MTCSCKTVTGKNCRNFAMKGSDRCHLHKIPISKSLRDCTLSGHKIIGKTVISKLKKETSLIGSAYLNYLYQNDIKNPHFCQSMLLMKSQTGNAGNPYIELFHPPTSMKTMSLLEDVQLCFDYSIGRTKAKTNIVQKSVKKLQNILNHTFS